MYVGIEGKLKICNARRPLVTGSNKATGITQSDKGRLGPGMGKCTFLNGALTITSGFHGPVFLSEGVDGFFAMFPPWDYHQMSTRLDRRRVEKEMKLAKCPRHENGAAHSLPCLLVSPLLGFHSSLILDHSPTTRSRSPATVVGAQVGEGVSSGRHSPESLISAEARRSLKPMKSLPDPIHSISLEEFEIPGIMMVVSNHSNDLFTKNDLANTQCLI